MELEVIYNELQDAFENYAPNDEDFLLCYPETAEEIEKIKNLNPTDDESYKKSISILHSFISEWFPDSIDEADQTELKSLLNEASKIFES